MTADADATGTTPVGRRGRAPFELLRFTATPVPGALVVAELEGRFAQSGRFTRQPMLVVEATGDRPRLELAPVRATVDAGRWRAAYAVPAEAYATGRFALGLRGTLLDLPAPDEPGDAERLTALAREANSLRRQLEAAEADAAAARAEASASAAELGAAVLAARDGAVAESAERIAALEDEVLEAHRAATADAATASATAEAEWETAVADLTARHDRALADATTRAEEAETRAEEAETRTTDAEARARLAEAGGDQHQRRRAADAEARALAAEEGIAVLRAELAEERERSELTIAQLAEERSAAVARLDALRHAAEADAPAVAGAERIADLEQQLAAATSRVEALRRAAAADARKREDEDETRVLWAPAARPATEDPDQTQVLSAVETDDDEDETRPFAATEERDAEATGPVSLNGRREHVLEPVTPEPRPRQPASRGLGAWIAVAALALFAFVLLGLLLGFLA
jgi:hypothetical protein